MKHFFKKSLGQNFLNDQSIIDRMIQSMRLRPDDCLVEIGPGQGALTRQLLEHCPNMTAIEYDRDLIAYLSDKHPTLNLVHQDALNFDFNTLIGEKPLRIVGNLPYNISTPLLFHFLQYAESVQDLHLMLQKEVVERISSPKGSKQYGRLSVMVQYLCKTETVMMVPNTAFYPPPKVQSAVVRLVPYNKETSPYPVVSREALNQVVLQAFSQRRKTLRNALKTLISEDQMAALNIEPTVRPEQVSVAEFVALALCYEKAKTT